MRLPNGILVRGSKGWSGLNVSAARTNNVAARHCPPAAAEDYRCSGRLDAQRLDVGARPATPGAGGLPPPNFQWFPVISNQFQSIPMTFVENKNVHHELTQMNSNPSDRPLAPATLNPQGHRVSVRVVVIGPDELIDDEGEHQAEAQHEHEGFGAPRLLPVLLPGETDPTQEKEKSFHQWHN